MNATMAKKLRFGDAAYGMKATPKTLRNWLQRESIRLVTARPAEQGWTEYSFADIAVLVLTRTLVDFGVVPVSEACEMAHRILALRRQPFMNRPENMPADAYPLVWVTHRLLIWRDGDHWQLEAVVADHSPVEPAPAFITLDVATLLREAFERAEESNTEGVSE